MDGLSASASIIIVIQVSGQIFSLCWDYYFAVKDARDDIQLLLNELTALQDVLESVAEMVEISGNSKLSILEILSKPNGPLQQYSRELSSLVTKLNSDAEDAGEKMRQFEERGGGRLQTRMWRRVWARLEGIIDVSLALTADQK